MSRGSVTTGTCPRCFTEQPLIWDGTIRPHSASDDDGWPTGDCKGSLHAPSAADEYPTELAAAIVDRIELWDEWSGDPCDTDDPVLLQCCEHDWTLGEYLALALVADGWSILAPAVKS